MVNLLGTGKAISKDCKLALVWYAGEFFAVYCNNKAGFDCTLRKNLANTDVKV